MMSPWFLGTSVFYDTVLINERLNLMNKYHFRMHLSFILIKSFIINLQFYPFWRYYLKVSLIPGCCNQLVPENRQGFRKLVSRVSMFSQLWNTLNRIQCIQYNAYNTIQRKHCVEYNAYNTLHMLQCIEHNS
jgi:hypothetical protein